MMKAIGVATAAAVLALLSGCGDRNPILPGTRLDVRTADTAAVPDEVTPITLAAAQQISAWPMRAGSAQNAMPHAAVGAAPAIAWSAKIGNGNSRRQRIAADPVAADGRIFAMDARSTITAVSEAGAVLWSRNLTPSYERDSDASGGGIGVAGDTLFVSTGFGEFHALDAATGAEKWVQRLDAPVTSPTIVGDIAYLVSRDNRAWAIKTDTGRILWELPASPSASVMATSPAPAVSDRLAIFPFGSGEVLAALRKSGIRVWGSSVAGERRGVAYASVGDITGDPVIVGDTLYAGTPSGRLVAMKASSGERLWTATEGAVSPVAVAGGSVFLVSDRAELLRLDAETGAPLWRSELPFFTNSRLKRRQAIYSHFGPILAGNTVWIASSDGLLRGFDPETGTLRTTADLPGGAATRPIVMNGAIYVVSTKGVLHAFR